MRVQKDMNTWTTLGFCSSLVQLAWEKTEKWSSNSMVQKIKMVKNVFMLALLIVYKCSQIF